MRMGGAIRVGGSEGRSISAATACKRKTGENLAGRQDKIGGWAPRQVLSVAVMSNYQSGRGNTCRGVRRAEHLGRDGRQAGCDIDPIKHD